MEPNKVGAPLGNQNAVKGKRWADAIERAISAYPNEPDNTNCSDLVKGLNKAAHKFVKKTMEEEHIHFFREFGDRLDGKAAQIIAGPDGGDLTTRLIIGG